MPVKTDWSKALQPLLERYKGKKHPLNYHSVYQLMVMVVLSAQTSDDLINQKAPAFFKVYPNMTKLSKAKPEELYDYLGGIRNFANKAKWLTGIAGQIGSDKAIPLSQEALTALPGIGRKSANVILREAGAAAEGIIVDLHVIRVATRLGITREEDPKKIEEVLMKMLPPSQWDAGMAMSFLGREICHPKPQCEICPMNSICAWYKREKNSKK